VALSTLRLEDFVRDVPDFPEPGVVFRDLTPLLASGPLLNSCVEQLAGHFAAAGVDKVVGIEARGFIIATPVALRLGTGFVPVRKAGKLPWRSRAVEYELEYGSASLEIHEDALAPGERVLVIDDVLATGGTAEATMRLVEGLGAQTVGFGCVVELDGLRGRQRLGECDIISLVHCG
jgi:adenine phosphoribosyltransferase